VVCPSRPEASLELDFIAARVLNRTRITGGKSVGIIADRGGDWK